ncbi:8-amino-7-oxononanoate synthase [Thiorhodospira sibirica]|uniref:8-amino-7-oxononanoate synthase n=1 Tax=Thiorhodospira sibirica TaxID=154347 RepID=UPI00022C0587|nr:8-amino-7-oxononanoate synthase [Thiorhodospira sibirica]
MNPLEQIPALLARRQVQGLYRQRRVLDGAQQPEQIIDGKPALAFCANDYLGLAQHPKVRAAFVEGIQRYGVGSGAAHLVNGHSQAHHALEQALARLLQRPAALLFSSGYLANLGVLQALMTQGGLILQDRLNHASLLDGARLSRARWLRYRHRDLAHLQRRLSQHDTAHTPTLIISDGVFSMDGDIAPLPQLAQIAQQHQAALVVDDAHGIGVLGPDGAGTVAQYGLREDEVPVLIGTLGKALGTAGAFVAGSEALIAYLMQTARSYIYTTASPPALAHATLTSLQLLQEEPWRRTHLHELIQYFRGKAQALGLTLLDSHTPIQPIILGESEKALQCSAYLLENGLLVPAIRPPTVPAGSARLRITLSAAHEQAHVDHLLAALARLPLE